MNTIYSTNEGSVQKTHKKKRQRAGNVVNASNRYTNDDGRSSNTYGMRPLASIFSSLRNGSEKPKEKQPLTVACVVIDDSDDNTSEEEKSSSNCSSQPPTSQSYSPKPRQSKLNRAAGGSGLVLLSSNRINGCNGSHRPPPIQLCLASANAKGVCSDASVPASNGDIIGPISRGVKEEELWIDKYAPRKMDELVVHRKKVEVVRSWILEAIELSKSRWKKPPSHKLLALVGPSGSGKSAMIKAFASEFGIELSQWMDTSGMALPAFREKKECLGGGHGQRNELFHPVYSSQMEQFKEFISNARYTSLLSSGCVSLGRRDMKSDVSPQQQPGSPQVILLEDLPFVQGEKATEELQHLMANFVLASRHPIVLIITSDGVAASPNDIVKRILGAEVVCAPPTVKIISINRVTVTAIQKCLTAIAEREGLVNAEDAIESALESSRGDVRNAILTFQVNTRGLEVVPSSQQQTSQDNKKTLARQKGAGNTRSSNSKRKRYMVPPFIGGGSRDSFLNHFNSLGRLLYRKRDKDGQHLQIPRAAVVSNSNSGVKSNNSCMKSDVRVTSHLQSTCFDPGEIIQFSTLSSDRAAMFVQYHCIDLFTNVDELALALGSLSDADLFLAREFDGAFGSHRSGVASSGGGSPSDFFLGGYVSGIISRCVAAYNCNPAPSKFRQFSAPKWQDVRAQQLSGAAHMDAFFARSWEAEERRKGTGWGISRYNREDMALSLVPAARLITGIFQVDSALESLAQRSDEATGATHEVEIVEENCMQQDMEIEEFD